MEMGKRCEQQRRRSQYKDVLLSQPPPGSSEETERWLRTLSGEESKKPANFSCWLLCSRAAPSRCLIPLHFWVAHESEKLWGKKQEALA